MPDPREDPGRPEDVPAYQVTHPYRVRVADRVLHLDRPLDVFRTFALHRRGPHDPTMRLVGSEMWRATRTPEGPAGLYLVARGATVETKAWGPGATWVIDRVDRLVGTDDDPESFVPVHDVLSSLHRRMPGMRIGRTDRVLEALVPAIIEQKVTSHEAHRSYRKMVFAWGEPAPGPVKLRVPPAPERLANTPYYEFHRFGLERKRTDVIRAVCARATRLEECSNLPRDDAARKLRSFTGVGPWTVAEVAARAFGDADAVSVGDFHLPHLVSWALEGRPRGSDERMLGLLEPYAGQRGRAIRLIEAGVAQPPRRAPRQRIRSIASY